MKQTVIKPYLPRQTSYGTYTDLMITACMEHLNKFTWNNIKVYRTHPRVGRCRPSSNGFTCCNNTCTFLRKLRKDPLPSISLSWPQWLLRFSFVFQHPTLSRYNVRVGDENKGNDQWRYIILLTFNYLCSVSQLTLTYSMKSRDHWRQCFCITYSETCIKRTPSIKQTVAEVPIYFPYLLEMKP